MNVRSIGSFLLTERIRMTVFGRFEMRNCKWNTAAPDQVL